MHLSKIHIRNYRLFENTELDVDKNMTLIVGRNNTAKTSLFECLKTVLNMKPISFYDYPLGKRKKLIKSFTDFVNNKKTFCDLCQSLELFSIEFYVDYFENGNDDLLGELEPFIIEVDSSITTALICVKYELKQNEEYIRNLFIEKNFSKKNLVSQNDVLDVLKKKYVDLFEFNVFAVNPKNKDDKQLKTLNELKLLFPVYMISAERTLGEDENHNNSLSSLITSYFKLETGFLDSKLQSKIEELLQKIDNANKRVQKESENILGELIEKSIGFGYPNIDELQLGVITKLEIDNEIKNSTELSYSNPKSKESLPNSYNGLGYKNLIKIEFLLAMIAKEMDSKGSVCIPLLFIEEPESHMHPQMQQTFANYLGTFLGRITNKQIQTFITTHSSHIANNIEFSKIRYARKFKDNIIYLNFYKDNIEIQYGSNTTLKEFLELEYSQFLSAINFLYPDSDFSTEHGVKGEEYDNVIFVISKGWNQYQFEKYIPMITGDERIPTGKDNAFERNRNLFYVCCSRSKKRLIFFVTVQMEPYLYSFFQKYIGKKNIFTYKEYLDNYGL